MTQACVQVTGALWALDPALAHQRQFPAVDWETSYSLQADDVTPWFERAAGATWGDLRRKTLELLQRDRELREVAGLVGPDALEDADRLLLDVARLVRDLVIGQSAYDAVDARSPVARTFALVDLVHGFHAAALAALKAEAGTVLDVPRVRRALESVRGATDDVLGGRVAAAREEIRRAAGGAAA